MIAVKILVCTECAGKKACTLFYPSDERVFAPLFCGPNAEGYMKTPVWMEAPEEFTKVLFR